MGCWARGQAVPILKGRRMEPAPLVVVMRGRRVVVGRY
jgi:hypothetical protein